MKADHQADLRALAPIHLYLTIPENGPAIRVFWDLLDIKASWGSYVIQQHSSACLIDPQELEKRVGGEDYK